MSMNLHCNRLDLHQTPTWVTYMCMMTNEGPSYELKGEDAKRALRCYLKWCGSLLRSSWNSNEQAEVDSERAAYNYHVNEVMDIIVNDPDLTVCIM